MNSTGIDRLDKVIVKALDTDWGGRTLPLHGCAGGVVGYINSSQDGAICHRDAIVPCLTSGHGNCPKVIEYDDGK